MVYAFFVCAENFETFLYCRGMNEYRYMVILVYIINIKVNSFCKTMNGMVRAGLGRPRV